MQADLFEAQITPQRVLETLRHGASNGISARALVRVLCGEESAAGERRLRAVIEALRLQGHAVCATPDTGYFLASNEDELNATLAFLYRRAMTSLRQVAGVRRVALPDLAGQLRLPADGDNPPCPASSPATPLSTTP